MAAALERDLHDALVVRKERAVAVAKVEAPDLDVLVGRAGDDELRVGRDVEREDGELRDNKDEGISVCCSRGLREPIETRTWTHLVAVEREEELERVGVEDLDGRVEERHGEEPAVRAVLDGEDVVGHLERLDVREREDPRDGAALDLGRHLAHLEVPELDVLVGRARDEAATVGPDVQRPKRRRMRGERLEEGGRRQVVQEELARLGADDDLQEGRVSGSSS